MRKIKSRSWKKQRYFKLQDDCSTIWYQSKKAGNAHCTCKSPRYQNRTSVVDGGLLLCDQQDNGFSLFLMFYLLYCSIICSLIYIYMCMSIYKTIKAAFCSRLTPVLLPLGLVSVSDVEAIREGHQSELLLSIADEFPPDRCFTLVFRGRRGNLDLVAESAEEAQSWIRGMRKLIENLENMGEREKLDQYPSPIAETLSLYIVNILIHCFFCCDSSSVVMDSLICVLKSCLTLGPVP